MAVVKKIFPSRFSGSASVVVTLLTALGGPELVYEFPQCSQENYNLIYKYAKKPL